MVFQSNRDGPRNLYWKAADGTGQVDRLTTSESIQAPADVSPDGSTLLFVEARPLPNADVGALSLDGNHTVDWLVGEKMEAPPGFEPGMEVLQTSALPLGDGAVRTGFSTKGRRWSGKRDSNPRLRPWQGRTLPLSYSRPLNLKTAYHAGGGPSKRAARRRHRYEPTTGITNPRRRRWSRPQIPAAHPASARRQHQSGTRRHPDGYGPDSPAPFA